MQQLDLLPDEARMYRAFMERDSSFEGSFFVGVKTTGIFCRPTCTARKPKRENVIFFRDANQALQHGYRPCKVCSPMARMGEVPIWLKPLMDEVAQSPDIRLKDRDIRQRNLDPARVRRWFQKHHGMTFQAYLRALRMGRAFGQIAHGEKVTHAAFDSGFESLSGFAETFKKATGFSPRESRVRKIVTITRILTPLGPMLAGTTGTAICLLEFVDRRMLETQLNRLKTRLKARCIPGEDPLFESLNEQLKAYFEGRLKDFDLPLELAGTDFQEQVWRELLTIPYGETRTYQDQATGIGNPKAVRAVARANGDNRISIIVPCHRVIGKDGTLTGYGGGLWRKQHLLELERRVPGA